MRENTLKLIRNDRLICIVRGIYGDDCLRLAEAISKGGVHLLEVTFDQSNRADWEITAETIRHMNEELGSGMAFGAGTVTSEELVRIAKEAGARFIVSPDTNEKVIRLTRDEDLVSIPGAFTPTEILSAWKAGGDFIKVFPASSLGPAYFKTVHAPLSQVPMLAVDSVTAENLPAYLKAGAAGAGIGGVLVNKKWIADGEFNKITAAAEELSRIVEEFGPF